MSATEWVRFTVHSDYAAKQWALYMNGSRIAAELGFFYTGGAAYTEYGIRGAGSSNAPADSITICTSAPTDLNVPTDAVSTGTTVCIR